MPFSPLASDLVTSSDPSVVIVGGRICGEVTLADIHMMRRVALEGLRHQRPTLFVWDTREATRAGSPEVRLASLQLRTDLVPELESYELGTLMFAPSLSVSRVLLRIIVKGMPRGRHIYVVDDRSAAQATVDRLTRHSRQGLGQRQAASSP